MLAPFSLIARRASYPLVAVLLLLTLRSTAAAAQSTDVSAEPVFLPFITVPAADIVIAAAHIDSVVTYEPDEAILLENRGGLTQSLAGWQILTASRRATFPLTTTLSLAPGQSIWCAAEDRAFLHSFGRVASCAWDVAEEPDTVLIGGSLAFANHGGYVQVRDDGDRLVDALLYGDASEAIEGWSGPPAQAYERGAIGEEGQVWQRKRHPDIGYPLDTDTASDWAGDLADIDWGRRVFYPGWETDKRARPSHGNGLASVTVAVAPEGLFEPINQLLASAQHTIDLSLYVFEHPELASTVADAARRGVRVRLLLEGSPVGGITDLQRWCVAHMAASGAEIRYLAVNDDAPSGYEPRYRYAHAKYGVVDGTRSLIGSENLTWDAAPVSSEKPVGGRRGFFLITDAASVAGALSDIFASDWRPDLFFDLHPYQPAHAKYGDPSAGYTLPEPPEYWWIEAAPFAESLTATGQGRFVVVTAPENALRPDDGLFALLKRAGPGDEILVAQLYEHKYWGDPTSNPVADPNPRLELLVAAARRGVRVRLLLDELYDDEDSLRSNRATADYLNGLAQRENLDMQARLGNPTGGGLHAKLHLLRIGEEYWSAVGSLNGGEISHKLNREVVLMVEHPAVYHRLEDVFLYDWSLGHR